MSYSQSTEKLEKISKVPVDVYNHNENVLYIVYLLIIIGFIVYVLNIKNTNVNSPLYMTIYLIILTISSGMYHLLS